MVMPRSCSSGRESRYLILPASLGEMMPLVAMRASVREVLPWSTWARMQICARSVCAQGRRVRGLGYVSDAFSRLLQRNELFGGDDRHGAGGSECGRVQGVGLQSRVSPGRGVSRVAGRV